MSGWRTLLRRAFASLKRSRFEREMHEEMLHHLDLEIRDRSGSGMSAAEARRTALRDFGGVDRYKDLARDVRGLAFFDRLVQDVTFGLRVLRRRPLFATTAIVALAIGIGFTTAAFSLANAVAFRPVPGIADADRVARLRFVADEIYDEQGFSYPNFLDLRAADLPAVEELIAWEGLSAQIAVAGGATMNVNGRAVAGDYFGALGVTASQGRLITGAETERGAGDAVVVVSELLAGYMFGDESPIGGELILNGLSFTVIGVAGGEFRGIELSGGSDLWIPFSQYARARHFSNDDFLTRRAPNALHDFAVRLAPDADAGLAQTQLRTAMARLVDAHPYNNGDYAEYLAEVTGDIAIHPAERERRIATLRLLMGAVALVLLVACANVANLLIFNGIRRRGESAVRQTLGASRGRLLRQHLTESALLAFGGVAGGLVLLYGLARIGEITAAVQYGASFTRVVLDWRVVVFAVGAGMSSVFLAGLAPAFVVHRFSLRVSMGSANATSGRQTHALRSFLTVAQLSLSVSLIVGALLLTRTVQNYNRIDMGYDARGIVEVSIDPAPQGYDDTRTRRFHRDLLGTGRQMAGVESAAGALISFLGVDLRAGSDPGDDFPVDAAAENVSPGFFRTLGVPFLAGRDFTDLEMEQSWATAGTVAILNESLALELFGRVEVVGETLVQRGYRANETLEVIGVVRDSRGRSVTRPPRPVVYRSLGDQPRSSFTLFLRTDRSAGSMIESVRQAVDRLDPAVPFMRAETTIERIRRATFEPRFLARLAIVLAVAATFLAAIGLYGLIGQSVAERRREVGIRIALGARPGGIIGSIVGRALSLTMLGVAGGAALGWTLARLVESRLYGVGALDPTSWITATAIFFLLGPLAAAAPARAAAHIDPAQTLKDGE